MLVRHVPKTEVTSVQGA